MAFLKIIKLSFSKNPMAMRKTDEIKKIICFLVNIIVYKILQGFWAHHSNYLFFDFSFWIYDN